MRKSLALLLLGVSTAQAATGPLTQANKDAILAKHNALRAGVSAPCTAADMETLVWDSTLEAASQVWADGCVGDHDQNRGSVGENLFMAMPTSDYTEDQLVGGVQAWYDEIQDTEWSTSSAGLKSKVYNDPQTTCQSYDGNTGACMIGHFTQVIWAKSNKLGCAVKTCSGGMTISGNSYAGGVLLVCRYTPVGNIAHRTNGILIPYMYGSKCATCSGSCSTAGLCDAGTTPNRCRDGTEDGWPYRMNGVDYTSCTDLEAAFAGWCANFEAAAGPACQLTCGVCTEPAGLGTASCGGNNGGSPSPPAPGTVPTKSSMSAPGAQFMPLRSALLVLGAVTARR